MYVCLMKGLSPIRVTPAFPPRPVQVDAAEEALGTALENEQSCKLRLADVTRTAPRATVGELSRLL